VLSTSRKDWQINKMCSDGSREKYKSNKNGLGEKLFAVTHFLCKKSDNSDNKSIIRYVVEQVR
jgi:hypothetical protein